MGKKKEAPEELVQQLVTGEGEVVEGQKPARTPAPLPGRAVHGHLPTSLAVLGQWVKDQSVKSEAAPMLAKLVVRCGGVGKPWQVQAVNAEGETEVWCDDHNLVHALHRVANAVHGGKLYMY